MSHFGILCPSSPGHLNPMMALGSELIKRNHNVTLFGVLDVRSYALVAGLNFCSIGETAFPKGSIHELHREIGESSGLEAMKLGLRQAEKELNMCLHDCSSAISSAGIEGLIIDQVCLWGGTVAEHLKLPFVSIANALPFNIEGNIPPLFTSWSYHPGWLAYLRNQLTYAAIIPLVKPTQKIIENYRKKWELPLYSFPNDTFSRLAQLSQQPSVFEFPRKKLPSFFHFTDPLTSPESREPIAFPYEKLTEKLLVYASLGTIQNRLMWIFQAIAEACTDLSIQLVISLGGGSSIENLPKFPGNTIVVNYAPQLELLKRASLTITHAGMNTTLESLSNGVPMVAIPIASDQPGIASRIAWTGTGIAITLTKVNRQSLRRAIEQVLNDDLYSQNALRLKKAIEDAGKLKLATDIVEQAITTKKPVYRDN
jgi:zeaxanthin glucosyltransferase